MLTRTGGNLSPLDTNTMESGLNAAQVQVGLTGLMDQFVFSKGINDQDYYMFRCAELKTRPAALNPFKKDVQAGPGGDDSYDIDRTGDVILEIDSFLGTPAIAAIGSRVVSQKVECDGTIGAFETGNAIRAALRSAGVEEEDVAAVAAAVGRAVDAVGGDVEGVDYDDMATNLIAYGSRLVNLSEAAAAAALRLAAEWKVDPAAAEAAGYSLKTGHIKTAGDDLQEVTIDNAQIAVRWVDYVAIRAQAYKALFLLQQCQTGFRYMYQYVYQVLLRAPGKKLKAHYGGFGDDAAGDAKAVAFAQRPQRIYYKNAFFFSEEQQMAYPYSNVYFHPLTLKSSYAALEDMYRMAAADKCGTPVHPKSKIEKVFNISDYVKNGGSINADTDLLALERAGKIRALTSDAVKHGHLILFATYTEADREALTEHNFVQLNTQVTEESRNVQKNSDSNNAVVPPVRPRTLNFMLKAIWLMARTAEATAQKRWFDFRGVCVDGQSVNPFETVQLEINGKGKFGCTDAAYFNRAAHLSAAEDVSELEESQNNILGLYFATKCVGPLYNAALNASKAGTINLHTAYKPEIFTNSDGAKQEVEEWMITAASNLSVYEGGKSGVRFMT